MNRSQTSGSKQPSLFDAQEPAALENAAELVRRLTLHARRMRTLLLTQVINYPETIKGRHEGWELFDLHALQLDAIQTVVDNMGPFEGGISRLTLEAFLTARARAMAPEAAEATHREVASWTLDWLLNADENELFHPTYVDYLPDGTLERKHANIRLLREMQLPDESIIFRASVEAINLLLGPLSEDVADAQRSEERLLADYIEAGRFDAARDSALRAQIRSIQYAEQVSEWLAAARQDLTRLDWTGTVRDELDKALGHIHGRLTDEARMRDRVSDIRRDVSDPDDLATMAGVLELLRDCHSRHTQLHGLLMEAGPAFRYEQERQRFTRPGGLERIALRLGLDTLLGLPIKEVGVAGDFFRALIGPVAPPILDMVSLAAELTASIREYSVEAPEIPEVVLEEASALRRFSEDAEQASKAALATVTESPRRLSELLVLSRRAAGSDPEFAAELTRIKVLWAFAPEGRDGGEVDDGLLSEKDRNSLEDYAYEGDDLLVHRECKDAPADCADPPASASSPAASSRSSGEAAQDPHRFVLWRSP